MLQGGEVRYDNDWSFVRNGDATLVTGTTGSVIGVANTDSVLYDKDAALAVATDAHDAEGKKFPVLNPVVWSTRGDSSAHTMPGPNDLGLVPEHLAMLAGLNPLTLHGASWQLVNTTPSVWNVQARVTDAGESLTIQMSLSRDHDDAPADITVRRAGLTRQLHVESFRRYGGTWVADAVKLSADASGCYELKQSWTLQNIQPSQPIALKATRQSVEDYRLLGNDLSWRTLMNADLQRNHDIVYYRWTGQFPSLDELRKLHDQQYPGEATPDPDGKTSMLPTAGGLLCLVGGILTYRRRSAS